MSSVAPEIALQVALALQGALLLGGFAFAFVGRFIHDLFIYLAGFVGGLWAGTVFLLPLYSSTAFAASQSDLVSGAVGVGIVGVSGVLGSIYAWRAYVAAVHFVGAALGFLATTTALGVPPNEAIAGVLELLYRLAIGGTAAFSGIIFALFGLLMIVVAVANLTDNLEALEPLADFWDDSIEDYRNTTLQSLLMIPFGVAFILVQVAAWVFDYSRELIISIAGVLLDPGMPVAPYATVLVGVLLTAVVVWKLHRAFLVVETAVVGAFLVAVSGTADRFVIAVLEADLRAAIQLVDVFSVTFLVVCLLGVLVQSGTLFFGGGDASA